MLRQNLHSQIAPTLVSLLVDRLRPGGGWSTSNVHLPVTYTFVWQTRMINGLLGSTNIECLLWKRLLDGATGGLQRVVVARLTRSREGPSASFRPAAAVFSVALLPRRPKTRLSPRGWQLSSTRVILAARAAGRNGHFRNSSRQPMHKLLSVAKSHLDKCRDPKERFNNGGHETRDLAAGRKLVPTSGHSGNGIALPHADQAKAMATLHRLWQVQ